MWFAFITPGKSRPAESRVAVGEAAAEMDEGEAEDVFADLALADALVLWPCEDVRLCPSDLVELRSVVDGVGLAVLAESETEVAVAVLALESAALLSSSAPVVLASDLSDLLKASVATEVFALALSVVACEASIPVPVAAEEVGLGAGAEVGLAPLALSVRLCE